MEIKMLGFRNRQNASQNFQPKYYGEDAQIRGNELN